MKSIAILCNYRLDPDRVGGMDYFFWAFDAACKQVGRSVTWYFPNQGSHGIYPDMHIIPAGEHSIENAFLNDIALTKKKYDTVITHFLEICTPFYKEVKQLTGARIIAVDHNPRPIEGYPLRKRLRKRINGMMYGRFIDQFIGVSDYTCKELIKDFGNRIATKTTIIYNGIDVSKIRTREKRANTHPSFLVACHLRESKGVQDLIQAISILPNDLKTQLHIDVYGDGPYRSTLEKMASSLQLNNNFSFKGSSDRLNEIYHKYDYLIHPSHMECFSLGILESLAANVPVITTPVGGNEEAVLHERNGYIFPVRDVKALSRIVSELYMGNMLIKENVSAVIRNRFTIQHMVTEHLAII